ncbi:uncharacterized protein LOC132553732 [Ylistrum balloti]|uniref:uncharacterized protein LOC132553732 n=1 Tax=Ylistrum balloti TaxID=509963 RepID=UPI002905AAF3|nr:uncharacterized protein LOC132553732 [Ylistrum balloti]
MYNQTGIGRLKKESVSTQNVTVVRELQSQNLSKDFATESPDLHPSETYSKASNDNVISVIHLQREDSPISASNNEVDRNDDIVNNEKVNYKLVDRLKHIQNVAMQNQAALVHDDFIVHGQLVKKDFDMAEQKRFNEVRSNILRNKKPSTDSVSNLPEKIHGMQSTGTYKVKTSVQSQQPQYPASSQNLSVQSNLEKYNSTFDCQHPREVAKVENILCMEKPKFLPDFKNPCWRDSPTTFLRCLPYFHIFGTCKSGTTDLFHRMLHHPQIIPNKGILSKETWFWSWKRYDRFIGIRNNRTVPGRAMTLKGFTDFFDAKAIDNCITNGNSSCHNLVTGHGDPMDIWDFTRWRNISQNNPMAQEPKVTTPYLVHHVNPDIKLIALLREPAERTYSHYLHLRYGETKEAFHFHVVKTIKYLRDCEKHGRLRACVYRRGFRMVAPLHASLYYLHLTEWLKVFPRKQILLLTTEEYHKDTAGTLRTVFRHLDLDPMSDSDLVRVANRRKKYVSSLKAKLGDMLPQTETLLRKYFKKSIHKLVALLNDTKYLTWIDNNSSRDKTKKSFNTPFNKKSSSKVHMNTKYGDKKTLQTIHGLRLPTNNIPRADFPSNILQVFKFPSTQRPNDSFHSNSIPNANLSPNRVQYNQLRSNKIYEVNLLPKNMLKNKPLLSTPFKPVQTSNKIPTTTPSSDTTPRTKQNSNIIPPFEFT